MKIIEMKVRGWLSREKWIVNYRLFTTEFNHEYNM
jgi:hypothetical protein